MKDASTGAVRCYHLQRLHPGERARTGTALVASQRGIRMECGQGPGMYNTDVENGRPKSNSAEGSGGKGF